MTALIMLALLVVTGPNNQQCVFQNVTLAFDGSTWRAESRWPLPQCPQMVIPPTPPPAPSLPCNAGRGHRCMGTLPGTSGSTTANGAALRIGAQETLVWDISAPRGACSNPNAMRVVINAHRNTARLRFALSHEQGQVVSNARGCGMTNVRGGEVIYASYGSVCLLPANRHAFFSITGTAGDNFVISTQRLGTCQ